MPAETSAAVAVPAPAPAAVPVAAPRRSVDVARVGVVVLFSLTALSNVGALGRHLSSHDLPWQKTAEVGSSLLSLTFCALVVRAYLRRGAASATDRGPLVWLVAPVATVLPLATAAIPTRSGGPGRTALELSLTLLGLTVSVWALRSLAANLSIVPQARSVVVHGPYRWVRHPLYVGELVALCGLAVHTGRAWVGALVAVEVLLQVYRAGREERLLVEQVPGYDDYARRTARLLPGVW